MTTAAVQIRVWQLQAMPIGVRHFDSNDLAVTYEGALRMLRRAAKLAAGYYRVTPAWKEAPGRITVERIK